MERKGLVEVTFMLEKEAPLEKFCLEFEQLLARIFHSYFQPWRRL